MIQLKHIKAARFALGGLAALVLSAFTQSATAQVYSVPGNTPPVAVASTLTPTVAADASGIASVTLSGINSFDTDGYITLYQWDGDFLEAPLNAASPTVTVTLAGIGAHIITLGVIDDLGDPSDNLTTITITVTGSVAPTLVTPASNLTLTCNSNPQAAILAWLNNNGGAVVQPSTGLTWSNTYSGLVNGSATVTFTATNAAGASVSTTATVTSNGADTIAPVINPGASNLTVECNGTGNTVALNAWLASHGGARAKDNCSCVTWTHNYCGLSQTCGCTKVGFANVTFKAKDAAGNFSTTTATFRIVDTTPPALDWDYNGCIFIDDGDNITVTTRDLPDVVHAKSRDLCGKACTLTTKYTVTGGCASICKTGGTFNIYSASAGTTIKLYARAKDACGNYSAWECVTVHVVAANCGQHYARCHEGWDDDDDCWEDD